MSKTLLCVVMFCAALASSARGKFSVDSAECDEIPLGQPVLAKTGIRTTTSQKLKAYGELRVTRIAGKKETCRAIYRLFVATENASFRQVIQIEKTIEGARMVGIELIGFSPDRSKIAANFLEAEGDWQGQGPVVFDVKSGAATYRDLGENIQNRINGCDQLESFAGVTNEGDAVFDVPPSIYDDSPECGDKGVWHFNVHTGQVVRAARFCRWKWR